MSDVSESSSTRAISDVSGNSPIETYSASITTVKLEGTNFLTWSQSAKLTIRGCGK